MKNLKLIYSLLVMLVAGLFASCTSDPYAPGKVPAGPQVCFSVHNDTVFDISGEEKDDVQYVTLTRMVTDAELSVPVIVDFSDPKIEDDKEELYDKTLFTVDEVVTFAAGESVAKLAIKADSKRMEEGKEYTMNFLLADTSQTTEYGDQQWTVTFRLFPWDRLKGEFSEYGKFCGGDFFTGEELSSKFSVLSYKAEVDVEVYTHKKDFNKETGAGRYLVYNPWDAMAVPALGYPEPDEDTSKAKHLIINCMDPSKCYIEAQSTGLEQTSGSEWHIASVYNPNTENPDETLAGVLDNGVITWPANSLYIFAPKYSNNHKFVTAANGMFRIALPDGVPTDYTLSVKYDGTIISSDYEDIKAKFVFTHSADITGIKYYLAEGNVLANPADAIAALVNGTADNICEVEDFAAESEKTEISVDIIKEGVYTIVAAPIAPQKDNNGNLVEVLIEKKVALDSFYYSGLGGSGNHPCDLTVTFGKYSELDTEEQVEDLGDYNSFGYTIKGAELKSVSIYCWTTAFVEEYFAKNGGATSDADKVNIYKRLFKEEGVTPFTTEELSKINSAEGKKGIYQDLEDNTGYTVVVIATNNYEQKAIKEYSFNTTAAPAYAGELVEGKFLLKSKGDLSWYETVFEIKSYQGSSKKFLVSNIGYNDNAQWFATYDAEAGTLSLDGTVYGRKKEGNLFNKLFGYIEDDKDKLCYQYEPQLNKGDLKTGPIVLNIDKTTKQPIGLQNHKLTIQVYKVKQGPDGNNVAGKAEINHAGNKEFNNRSTTTITPYVEPQAPEAGEGGENTEGGENAGNTEGGENTENK